MGLDGGGEGGCAALSHRRHRSREVDLRPRHQGGGGAEGGGVGHGEARHVRLQAGESYIYGRGGNNLKCALWYKFQNRQIELESISSQRTKCNIVLQFYSTTF